MASVDGNKQEVSKVRRNILPQAYTMFAVLMSY